VEQYNLIVVKWGNLYNAAHVINLYEGAKRYTPTPFNFYVFTDDTTGLPQDKNWKFITLPEYHVPRNRGWWYKMEIFNKLHDLQGRNLYIDLDTVIVRNLSKFWELMITNGLYICRDFNRQFIPSYQACNSSVMGWNNSTQNYVYEIFKNNLKQNMDTYRGDQDYIQAHNTSRVFWPDESAMSWKWECWRGGKANSTDYKSTILKTTINPDTKILVFHGQPKPEQCEDKRIVDIWQGTVKYQ
jgi:hypothetical protein